MFIKRFPLPAAGCLSRGIRTKKSTGLSLMHPYFRVTSWPAARPIMLDFLDRTMMDPLCIDCGWTRAGDQLLWRSAFSDADAMLASFSNVSPLISAMLAGPATMDRLEVHGPSTAMEVHNSIFSYITANVLMNLIIEVYGSC